MSRPDEVQLEKLGMIASELQEVIAERGYRVDVALNVDPAFGSGQARAWLLRDLVMDAIDESASRVGVEFQTINGGGRELQTVGNGVIHRFRCKSASRISDDQIEVLASSDSPLVVEEGGMYAVEPWIFGYISSSPTMLDEVFIAPILDFVEGNPGHFDLGRPIQLLGSELPPKGSGFKPSDEGLEGFGDDDVASGDADSDSA
ncbi:hypothetical protein [Mycolicibacterium lutetiense]|uniref:Uncharacterized protein n=1 Tax=Mycolicibacterium lutetiense TaxID=1641992 RepID=A0ABS4ZSA7_9MYCO|nr:hypothetical protein [Mycolicibacterium lutetiense]MBP2452391.1 hypothetical protein [Mycolicibacterium lutetiense]